MANSPQRRSFCGASLGQAIRYEREDVICQSGEYVGEGVEVTAFCGCGASRVVPWSVSPKEVT